MTEALILPSRLDSTAAPALSAALLARRGGPLVIDAAQVDVIGALAFEVMVAAGRQWRLDGHVLSITGPSDRYLSSATTLGLNPLAPWSTGPQVDGRGAA